MSPVQKNDILIIPAPSDDSKRDKRITINWSQSWSSRSGDYYTFVAKDRNQGELDRLLFDQARDSNVVIFIQVESYNDGKLNEYDAKSETVSVVENGRLVLDLRLRVVAYEINVTDKLQYGQKTAGGEGRFVVLHDKGREMYQHRFIESALGSSIIGLADKVNGVLAVVPATAKGSEIVKQASGILKSAFGDYLRTF